MSIHVKVVHVHVEIREGVSILGTHILSVAVSKGVTHHCECEWTSVSMQVRVL